jgi:hypothetical protein
VRHLQRCDSSSWAGTRTTCRKFPTRSQDCSTPLQLFTLDALTSTQSSGSTPAGHTASAVNAFTSLEPSQGLGKGEHDHGKEKENEMWTFCDSWITAG